jgi:hypothetical protein
LLAAAGRGQEGGAARPSGTAALRMCLLTDYTFVCASVGLPFCAQALPGLPAGWIRITQGPSFRPFRIDFIMKPCSSLAFGCGSVAQALYPCQPRSDRYRYTCLIPVALLHCFGFTSGCELTAVALCVCASVNLCRVVLLTAGGLLGVTHVTRPQNFTS